jgi:hypothetical protein
MVRLRPDVMTPYRVLFMIIFMVIGILGIGTYGAGTGAWLFAGFDPSANDHRALAVAAGVGGFISLIFGVMLIFLVFERRTGKPDRRRLAAGIRIRFEDRRSGEDRRAVVQAAAAPDATPRPQHPRTV